MEPWRRRGAAAALAMAFLVLPLGSAAGGMGATAGAGPVEAWDAEALRARFPDLGAAVVRCDELPPPPPGADGGTDPTDLGPVLGQVPQVLPSCPAAIRPGAASNSCTLNFLVTDGSDLYIGAAGHCAFLGKRLRVAGVPGEVGTAVAHRNALFNGDWAFFRIDPEDRQRVDPTMCRWGGPTTNALGEDARAPLTGEVVLHYGHGVSWGRFENTRGRAGVALGDPFAPSTTFSFAGSVAGGDSGSPVRLATGEAAGIAIATLVVGYVPNLVVASRFDLAMADLEARIGRPVWVVDGDPLPMLPGV